LHASPQITKASRALPIGVQVNIKKCLTIFRSTVNAPVLFVGFSRFINNGAELFD
jgi:hypothetical protein